MAFIRNICKAHHHVFNSIYLRKFLISKESTNKAINLYYETQKRETSFLTTVSAEQLWKGVTSVSNAGRKRGRGKGVGKRTTKDLNRGQILGSGKINMVWPGLNAPIIRGKEVVQRSELPPDLEREERLIQLRNSMKSFSLTKLHPLERGFSGTKMPGRSVGPPDPIGDEKFENFDTKVLEMRMVATMKGNLGRTRKTRVMCVTGNKNGLAGIGMGGATDGRIALKKARNNAAQKLQYIPRYDNHTVCHDFVIQFHKSRLVVKKKPKGYGLVCHRVLKEICEMIGIKDIFVKVETSKNPLNITKAFMQGLQSQKTHQELANAMGLHVVEFRPECDNFPKVIASPEQKAVRTRTEIPAKEITDYNEIINEGKVEVARSKKVPFYKKLPSWEIRIKKTLHQRNFKQVRTRLLAEHGALKSFLTIREEEAMKAKTLAATTEE